MRLSDDRPSSRFFWWVRGVILALWAGLLVAGVPGVVTKAKTVLSSQTPGPARSQELRNLAVESIIIFIAVPPVVLGVFGFGVIPRRGADRPPHAKPFAESCGASPLETKWYAWTDVGSLPRP